LLLIRIMQSKYANNANSHGPFTRYARSGQVICGVGLENETMAVEIFGPVVADLKKCEQILRALPDYFGIEDALVQYLKDIEKMPVFVASLKGKAIGFLATNRHTKVAAEIHVMGVLPEEHRKGVGSALIEAAEEQLRSDGTRILEVKTIGESHPDKNYAETRKFYSAQGFLPLEEIHDFWGKGLHTLFMVKPL